MAEPEDPREDEPDEAVEAAAEPTGSPVPEPEPLPEPEPEPEPAAPAVELGPVDDDLIGFCNPRSLTGERRAPQPVFGTALAGGAAVLAPADDLPRATRPFARPKPRPEEGVTAEPESRMALTIYGLLVGSVLTLGLSVLPALYLAWISRLGAEGWTRGHLLYQLRTSLVGTVAGAVGVLALPVGLGVFILTATLAWVVVRGSAGLIRLVQHKAIKNPRTWSLP